MTLKDYLKKHRKEINILWFENGNLNCENHTYKDFNQIDKELLCKTVMEVNEKDKEVWIR